jgi:hypothetical protein
VIEPVVVKFSLPNDIAPELSVIDPPLTVNIAEVVVSAKLVELMRAILPIRECEEH